MKHLCELFWSCTEDSFWLLNGMLALGWCTAPEVVRLSVSCVYLHLFTLPADNGVQFSAVSLSTKIMTVLVTVVSLNSHCNRLFSSGLSHLAKFEITPYFRTGFIASSLFVGPVKVTVDIYSFERIRIDVFVNHCSPCQPFSCYFPLNSLSVITTIVINLTLKNSALPLDSPPGNLSQHLSAYGIFSPDA